MIGKRDPAQVAIDDARALLQALMIHGWREIHVRTGDTKIFIAQENGAANPMRNGSASTLVGVSSPAAANEQVIVVTAPHVATLESVVAVGTRLAVGESIATLRVLDDLHPLAATVAGTVVRVDAAQGQLLDYKAAILAIAPDA